MIKKLDLLILRSFIGPFIVTFFIALFVLLMQTVWKYIDDLVGKGLDFGTIGLFLFYMSATLLILAMPIAILISSIMTFGNLGESFELVAIKSSGISLLRFMRPLIWVAILLSGVTFMFANYVIPYANLKSVALYNDILYKKPAFDLKEGIFYTNIPTYAIKVGKKESDGKTIRDVLIYEQTNPLQDNCIIAKSGVMKISDDQRYLEFNLEDGFRYQETGNVADTANEFIRVGFKSFKKLFDLSSLQKQTTNDSVYRNSVKMLNIEQIDRRLGELKHNDDSLKNKTKKDIALFLPATSLPDSSWKTKDMAAALPAGNKDPLFPDSLLAVLRENSVASAENLKGVLVNQASDIQGRDKEMRLHKIEWHRKFSLSLACLVLFFIGAPLGSIIRKGGLGMPLVVAIIFFLIFHLLNMFGEKFVKEDILSPFLGMWLAVIVLTPVGIFFTYKAMHDSQLFNKEFYYRAFKKIQPFLSKFIPRKKLAPQT